MLNNVKIKMFLRVRVYMNKVQCYVLLCDVLLNAFPICRNCNLVTGFYEKYPIGTLPGPVICCF